jgi:hypothetical protein
MKFISSFKDWSNSSKSQQLFKLDESNMASALTKDEFLSLSFPNLFESANDYRQEIMFALYEAYLMKLYRKEWFSKPLESRPLLIESDSHAIIIHNNQAFAITNESFEILSSFELNENIFSDAWDSVSNFFTNAWDGVKSVGNTVGDWIKDLSDSAKSATGFIKLSYLATKALQSDDWKEITKTVSNISYTLASTYSKSMNLDQTKLAATISGCSGILNLSEGRTTFLTTWGQILTNKPGTEDIFAKALVTISPDTFLGTTKMCIGIRDLALSINPQIKFENITNIDDFSDSKTNENIKESGMQLSKEEGGMGLSKSIIGLSPGQFAQTSVENYWKPLLACQISHCLENVYPAQKKEVIEGLKQAKTLIPKAKELPQIIENIINKAEKTEYTGTAGLIKSAVQSMGQPMIQAIKNFTTNVLPDLVKTSEWMVEVVADYDKATTLINTNCKPAKTNLILATLPIIKTEEANTKLTQDEINVIQGKLSDIAKSAGVEIPKA